MIVLRSPKGWTGPKKVDGKKVEGYWRAHQVPLADVRDNPEHLKLLEKWLKSYRPQELFDANGRLIAELQALAPKGRRRMSANPHANGGLLRRALRLPDFRDYAVPVKKPGTTEVGEHAPARRVPARHPASSTRTTSASSAPTRRPRTSSTPSTRRARRPGSPTCCRRTPTAASSSPDGRVMEMLSEHTLEGWLEGYLLTGRHGFFSTYEAFVHVIDSMFNQHAKWLDICEDLPVARAGVLAQPADHLDRLAPGPQRLHPPGPGLPRRRGEQEPAVTRIYLPPDANCLLSVADHCLRSTDYINVIVCDKQKHLQYLDMDAAIKHCTKGIGIWDWASNDQGGEPDVVMAGCGDIATQEALAAVALLRQHFPDLKIRFVNVVDLYRLTPPKEHPHGLSDRDFDTLFTTDKPIIFNFHGYPWLIHRLAYRRTQPREPARARLQGEGQHQHAARARDQQRGRPLQPGHRRRSTACRGCRSPAPTSRRSCATCRSSAATTPTSTASTATAERNWKWPL